MNKVFSFAIGDLFSRGDGTLEWYQYLMLFGGAFVLVAVLLLIVYFILFARHKRYLAANDRVETDTLKIPNTKRMTSTDYNEMLRELNAIHEDAALREFVRNPIEAELVIAEDRIKYMQGLGYRNYNDASINEMNELIKRLRAENFAEVKVSLFKKADGTVEETILEDAETARRSALIRDAIDYENARRDVAIRQLQLELEILTAERAMQAAQECIDRCARELGENSMVAVLTPAERYDLLREQAHYIRDLKESSDTVERLRAESRKLGERETSAVFTLNDTVHDSERLKAESEARRLDAEQRAGEADGRRIALERRLAELEEKMRYSADAGSRESDIESVRIISAYERERLFERTERHKRELHGVRSNIRYIKKPELVQILLNKVREFEQGFLPDVCTPELLAAVERLRTDIVTAGEIAELKKLLGGNRTEPPRTGRTGYGAQRRPGAGYRQVPRPYRP